MAYGNTPEALVANLGQVQKASHWMIGKLEEAMAGTESEQAEARAK